ncbi:hypothetical protein JL720_2408 [Aureococcus anophagefferens]|nr:hypothetical protein JL720_2408 [Aureococcus anophagefferens]
MRVALVAVAAAAYVPDLDGVGTETPYADLVAAMSNATAQRFVQGAHFLENFNHHEAKRSMVAAAEADPDCAMCWWGVSASLGPYLNAPFFTNASDLAEAKFAADRAAALADAPKAAAIAEAAAARYACNVSLASQTAAFENYSDLLAEAHGADRSDDDVATLYAESLLLLDCDFAGYHFYDMVDGALTPTPRVRKALAALRAVVGRSAHPLAEHLLIHATEETAPGFQTPGGAADGERSADLLAAQFEGSAAQHLIHMSSHTYLRAVLEQYATGLSAFHRGDGAGASAAYDALQAAAARLPADDDAPTDGQRGADVLRNVSLAANATLFAALLPDRCASAAVLRAAAKRFGAASAHADVAISSPCPALEAGKSGGF